MAICTRCRIVRQIRIAARVDECVRTHRHGYTYSRG
jgi:hypothetical protein